MSKQLLITGGAGYIGSHMVKLSQENGFDVVVIDDFSSGNKWAVKNCEVLKVNLLDSERLSKLLKGRSFEGVIHFAGKSLVKDSFKNPNLYFQNNVSGSINLINEMLKNDLNRIVFSSSAAIFGNPVTKKIKENHPKVPINPYGSSKLIVENILEQICSSYDFNAICLRYFNAAGADVNSEIGEAREPETHIIPNILKAIISNKTLEVFGNDYPTSDGTCIRDYIHVTDLSEAHLLSLEKMNTLKGFNTFNLGNQKGFSVLDLIKKSEEIVGKKITYEIKSRRKGDPSHLISSSSKAKKMLNWNPKNSELEKIIQTAYNWHLKFDKY